VRDQIGFDVYSGSVRPRGVARPPIIVSMKSHEAERELAKLRSSLAHAVESPNCDNWPNIVRKTIRRIDDIIEQLEQARAEERATAQKMVREINR
jgi:hypothetical protein